MSINCHPSDATLSTYSGGTLPAGSSLVVASHLGFCNECRRAVATWEMAGGAVLDSMPETEMASDALLKTMARLGSGQTAVARQPRVVEPNIQGIRLPPVIVRSGVADRRPISKGIWVAPLPSVSKGEARTYLLRLGPNRKLPLHGHSGPETVCVLKGSFYDETGRYEAGDFIELDEATDHQPKVGPEGECICIIAAEAPPKVRGFLGWFARPFWMDKLS